MTCIKNSLVMLDKLNCYNEVKSKIIKLLEEGPGILVGASKKSRHVAFVFVFKKQKGFLDMKKLM